MHTHFAINKLSLNICKTNFMVLVGVVYFAKYLVVLIDSELTWKAQSINTIRYLGTKTCRIEKQCSYFILVSFIHICPTVFNWGKLQQLIILQS